MIGWKGFLKKKGKTCTGWRGSCVWMVLMNVMFFRFLSFLNLNFHDLSHYSRLKDEILIPFLVILLFLVFFFPVPYLSGGAFYIRWLPRQNMGTWWEKGEQTCIYRKELGWNCSKKRFQRLSSVTEKPVMSDCPKA